MSETNLWHWLAKAKAILGSVLDMGRVENVAGTGMPDVEGCYLGDQFWLELKFARNRPVRATSLLQFGSPLRPAQKEWADVRLAAGGAVAYLIQVGAANERAIYLVHGRHAVDLERGVTESWCKLHNLLDRTDPVLVIQHAVLCRA